MTRRAFFAAAAAVAGAAALSGCSGADGSGKDGGQASDGYVDFDLSARVLPLGSVVVLGGEVNPGMRYMVTSRRPLASGSSRQYDYAAVIWPLGRVSDIAGAPYDNEMTLFDADAVEGVVFVGYDDGDLEARAAEAVAAARETGEPADSALFQLGSDMGVFEGGDPAEAAR